MVATWVMARRSLTANRVRFVASVGGVALALSLVLALDAIVAGVSAQLTSYIDHAGADVWVAQAGVRNLHMVASWLPASDVADVADVKGVAAVTPILYVTYAISANDQRAIAYVIGLPSNATMGTPWQLGEGKAPRRCSRCCWALPPPSSSRLPSRRSSTRSACPSPW